jgi:hypothetical protein
VFGALMAAVGVVYFLAGFSSVTAPEFATSTAEDPAWTRWMVEWAPEPAAVAHGRALVGAVASLHASGNLFYVFLLFAVPAALRFLRGLNQGAFLWQREAAGQPGTRGPVVLAEDRIGALMYLGVITAAAAVVTNLAAHAVVRVPLFASMLQGALLGATVWLLWSPWGVARRFAALRGSGPAASPLWRVTLRGAVAGATFLTLAHPERWDLRMWLLDHIRGFGDYDPLPWLLLAAAGAGFYAIKFWVGGCVGYSLAASECPGGASAGRLCLPLVALLVYIFVLLALHFGLMAPRYDVGRSLDEVVALDVPAAPARTVVTFLGPNRAPLLGVTLTESREGLPLSSEGTRRVEEFLKSRGYRTALSRAAFRYRFETSCDEWALERELDTLTFSCQRCQFWSHAAILADLLSGCPITPQAERALDTLAAPRYFRYPTAESRRTVAGLMIRFGRRSEALKWLKDTGLDDQTLRLTEAGLPPRFDRGQISGHVMINGRPAAQVRVGAIRVEDGLALGGSVSPMRQRVVRAATTTDSEGRFVLDRLGRGNYLLAISTPTSRLPAARSRLRFEGQPGQIPIGEHQPTRNVGVIRIEVLPAAWGHHPGEPVAAQVTR